MPVWRRRMRITDVRGYSLKAKVEEPFEWPDGNAYWRYAGVVRVETDEGLVGWGPGPYGWSEGAAEAVREVLVGRSPSDAWPLRHELALRRGHIPPGFLGALDIALWDLRGKASGEPIHRLLGGALRDSVPAYATGGYYLIPEDSIAWLRDRVQEAVEPGFRYYKMKVGARDVAYDLQRVEVVQEAMGSEGRVAVDSTTAYNLPLAMQVGRELQGRDILWFEDPLPAEDIEGYLKLADGLDIPITAHYGASGPTLFELIRRRAVDQVQPSIDGVGASPWPCR
jgi:D-galactarolactone cycloisomerase